MKNCPLCQTELPAESNLCPSCGSELLGADQAKSSKREAAQKNPLSVEVPEAARTKSPPGNLSVEVPDAARAKSPPSPLSVEVPEAARVKTPPSHLSVEVPAAARAKTPPSHLSIEVPQAARARTGMKSPPGHLSIEVPSAARVKTPASHLSIEVPPAARAKPTPSGPEPVDSAQATDSGPALSGANTAGHISDHPPPAHEVMAGGGDPTLEVRLRAEEVLDGNDLFPEDDPLFEDGEQGSIFSLADADVADADSATSDEPNVDEEDDSELEELDEEEDSYQQEVSAIAMLDDTDILVGMGRLDSPKPSPAVDKEPKKERVDNGNRLETVSLAEDMHGTSSSPRSVSKDSSPPLETMTLAEGMHGAESLAEAAALDNFERLETMTLAEDMHGAQSISGDAEVARDSRGQLWLSEGDERVSELELAIARNAPPPTSTTAKDRLVHPGDLDPDELERKLTRLKPNEESLDAPVLDPFPFIPPLVEAVPKNGTTPFHWAVYWLRTRSIVKRQREALRAIGGGLSKVKREEARCVTALGHAARSRGVLPDGVRDMADAAEHVESAAAQRRERADLKYEERREARLEQEAVRKTGEAKLERLEDRHAPLMARYKEMRRRLAGAESTIRDLTKMELERRALVEKPPTEEDLEGDIQLVNERIVVTRKSAEELVKSREKAHREVVASLEASKKQRKKLKTSLSKAARVIKGIEAEMRAVRAVIQEATAKVAAAENQAKAAEVSSKRQREHADRSAAEFDAEVGVAMLLQSNPDPIFANLLRVVVKSKKQVAEVEKAYNKQQDHFESYDEANARFGKQFLFGGLGVLFIVVFALVIVNFVINVSAD